MKNKSKILLAVGLIVFALVCVFGGQALVQRDNERRLAELQAQQSVIPEVTPSKTPENVVYTLPPVVTYTLPPAATGSLAPAVDEVKTDEDGNVIITPDFENQGNGATEVVNPGVQVTANVGGGGGTVPVESDGAYHGEIQPSATPKPTQAPPPAATPKPTATPKPADKTYDDNGKPTWEGTGGEISPDQKWGWVPGFGWVEYHPGAEPGDDGRTTPDPEATLSGNKVGSFG